MTQISRYGFSALTNALTC